MSRAVVVGGGPVGALAATRLAKQGWEVHVLEKRGELPGRPPLEDTRAYCINIGPRGVGPLLAAGMDLSALAAPSNGRLAMRMVDQKGKVGLGSEVPIDPQKPLRLMMYRDELNSHVLREMRRLQPTVRLQLNTQVTRIDLDRRQVAFTEESRPEEVLSYDLLVGADGAGSIVRRAMAEVLPPGFCQQRVGDARYAMMALEHAADGEQTHSVFERHEFMAGGILWSDPGDGDRRVYIQISAYWVEKLREDPTALDRYIDDRANLPLLPELAREGAKALLHSRPDYQVLSKWTTVRQLTHCKAVLLGDAAHSMSPVLGQACSCGMEDATVFAGILEACGGGLDAALQQYNTERLPDVQALLTLNQMWSARLGTNQEGLSFLESSWMLAHKRLIDVSMFARGGLHKLAPSFFPPPVAMQCILGTRRYRDIFTEMYSVLAVIAGLCLIPTLLVLTRLARAF